MAGKLARLETLRQMVAANVGVTLLPQLAVMPPVAVNENLVLRSFSEPAPKRQLGLLWRRSDAREPLMREIAGVIALAGQRVLGGVAPAAGKSSQRP